MPLVGTMMSRIEYCGSASCAGGAKSILLSPDIFIFLLIFSGRALVIMPIRELILFLEKHKINSSQIALQQTNQPLKLGCRA